MRHRPKRENYPNGTYGEMDYQEYLERYCTYLENKNKALTKQCNIADVGETWSKLKEGDEVTLKCKVVKGKFELNLD